MKGIVEERAAMLGEYIIESKATVRSTAKKFGVSKSTYALAPAFGLFYKSEAKRS